MTDDFDADVVVIGAGFAGLGAARALQRAGKSVVVVEATGVVGGRARRARLEGLEFAGADARTARRRGPRPPDDEDRRQGARVARDVRLGRERRHFDADGAPAELRAAHDAFDAIEDDHAADESLLQYFVRKGVKSRCLDVADAVYANDYGESASELGAAEVAHEQKHWTGGEDYFVLRNGTLADAAAELARGLDVRLGWPSRASTATRPARACAAAGTRCCARCCVVSRRSASSSRGRRPSPALPPASRGHPAAAGGERAQGRRGVDRRSGRAAGGTRSAAALFPEVGGRASASPAATGARATPSRGAAARGLLDQLDAISARGAPGGRRLAMADWGEAEFWRYTHCAGCCRCGMRAPWAPLLRQHCTAGLDRASRRRWPTAARGGPGADAGRAEPPPAPARRRCAGPRPARPQRPP